MDTHSPKLKQLRAQEMPLEQLHTEFQVIILQGLAYALPAWGPLLSVDLKHKKLSCRRGTARCTVSAEILPIATQQCRNYLYDKS